MARKDDLLLDRLLQKLDREDLALDPDKYKRKAQLILDGLLPMQREMAEDWHKRVCLLTPGKNGKTWTVRARLVIRCLLTKNANCLYIGLSRDAAKRDIWNGLSGIRALCEAIGLKCGKTDQVNDPDVDVVFSAQELTAFFPKMGSAIRVGGADNMDAIEKYRGHTGYDEVWLDEAKSHSAELLKELIDEILTPRINWKDGVLGICGTPGSILKGYFYDLTRTGAELSTPYGEDNPRPLRWSCHRWSLAQNTIRLPGQTTSAWERALILKAENQWTDRNTTWRREYLGQWCAELTGFIYKFQQHDENGKPFNIWTPKESSKENPFGLPTRVKIHEEWKAIKWMFGVGMDMGEDDPFALETWAFSEHLPGQLYQVWEVIKRFRSEEVKPGEKPWSRVDFIGEALKGVLLKIQQYADYPICLTADMAHMGEGMLAEVQIKYGFNITKAAKSDKGGYITLVNDDLIDGRMFLLEKSVLATQMSELQYDETGQREKPGMANDACDATVYCRGEIIRFLTHMLPAKDERTDHEKHVEKLFKQLDQGKVKEGFTAYKPTAVYDPRKR